ncbi:hypothetical protein FD723_41480 (plasmid) [Nostoc sp. C052]|uniref:hypothetical protein n=1 Tax=Nostoc sp. C052 TaxID=2576902 RepID=UPI0015C33E5A|nr:hypothetical protein [Nostoc sp. C052]QLE46652.1 hypothetical protein FD723_41480 [Nostoc sp. C052]
MNQKKAIFFLLLVAIIAALVTIHPELGMSESPSLLHEAERELSLMKTSVYQHSTDVDEVVGRFNYDCSGFVDYALQKISPQAYAEVPVSKSKRPLAQDFYKLFSDPTLKPSHWVEISKVSRLRAGDIVVWLRPPESDSHNTGHVMVIGGKPTATSQVNERLIPVIDSTSSPHAQDSRHHKQTGLGTGVIGVIVESTDKALAFRWRGGESKQEKETAIAFGRLR